MRLVYPNQATKKVKFMGQDWIRIGGAREHNLKNISLEIPRNQLVVFTGLSGSGKSSLAFDTVFAEGRRKYVESLSSYARQFLDQMQKPDVDYIEGLSPAIAIEQRSGAGNPRSTIATTTEIYDYLRLLFAHVGQPHCPDTGQPISHHTTSDIVHEVMEQEEQTRLMVLAPITLPDGALPESVLEELARDGFLRVRINGAFMEIGEVPSERNCELWRWWSIASSFRKRRACDWLILWRRPFGWVGEWFISFFSRLRSEIVKSGRNGFGRIDSSVHTQARLLNDLKPVIFPSIH